MGTMIVLFIIAYLIGSIPFGLLLAQAAGLGDIRNIGSGNIGATNVLRTGNKKLAALTLLLDILKGVVAVLLAQMVMTFDAGLLAGLGVLLGHVYPVWLKFKGGKGVATALGVLIAINPLLGGSCIALWLITAVIFRISSLAALVAIGLSPAIAFFLFRDPVSSYETLDGSLVILFNHHTEYVPILCAVFAVLIFYKHRDNIKRLLNGTEPKIDFGKKHEPAKT